MVRIASVLSRQVVSIFIVVYAVAFWRSASRLPAGPAVTYPRLVIGVLLAFVLVEFVAGGWRAVHESDPDVPAAVGGRPVPRTAREHLSVLWREHHKTFVTIVATGIYIFVIEPLGFYIATAVYLAFILPYLGVRRPVALFALWAGSLLVAWAMFGQMLSVRLPQGLLG